MILPHSLLLWLPGFHDKKDTSITYMFCIDFIIGTEQNFMGQQVSMVSAPYNFFADARLPPDFLLTWR